MKVLSYIPCHLNLLLWLIHWSFTL